jgi:uncharacterized membrane protein YozB (DUF420 family)
MFEYTQLLPHLNAILNSTSAILLISGYRFIRLGRVNAHRSCQLAALGTSILFLASYVTFHYLHGSTRFAGPGLVRTFYLAVLLSHTVLAIVIVPLVIITVYRAAKGDFVRHKRIARITLPLWLYVSVTGVFVYLMLYQIYPSR